MKNTDIIKCLKANKKVSDYELLITHKESVELFYVLKHLEMNRAVDVTRKTVQVYVDKDQLKGSSTIVVTDADDAKSFNKKLNDAITAASKAMNKYYPLCEKADSINEKEDKSFDLDKIATKVAEIVSSVAAGNSGWINSSEIFISKTCKEFISSKGIHHKSYGYGVQLELVPTYTNGKEEIELYRMYESNILNVDELERKVKGILRKAELRSNAKKIDEVKLPKKIKVLVKNDMLQKIMNNFKDNLSYGEVFMKTSHYDVGSIVTNANMTMTLKPYAKGCYRSESFDNNGIVLKDRKVIKNGKVVSLWGDQRFGYYMNQKNITGNLPVIEVKAPAYDYSKEKHLIIENFSSPQLEDSTGYFGGEVRLARYFDGKKYIPLTGFAISGNIYEAIKEAKFSKREVTRSDYKGPKYLILDNISIN